MSDLEKSTAARVLTRAVETAGIERVAAALQVSPKDLEPFLLFQRAMSLPQQKALAMAVVSLSADEPELRRLGSSLLGQVDAAERYQERAANDYSGASDSNRV